MLKIICNWFQQQLSKISSSFTKTAGAAGLDMAPHGTLTFSRPWDRLWLKKSLTLHIWCTCTKRLLKVTTGFLIYALELVTIGLLICACKLKSKLVQLTWLSMQCRTHVLGSMLSSMDTWAWHQHSNLTASMTKATTYSNKSICTIYSPRSNSEFIHISGTPPRIHHRSDLAATTKSSSKLVISKYGLTL